MFLQSLGKFQNRSIRVKIYCFMGLKIRFHIFFLIRIDNNGYSAINNWTYCLKYIKSHYKLI